ncbi:5'-nucleotidase C-terminal domain-containing protein [Thermodesulfobium sp. 4217-1]|uniref:bifunctional metallophosphatase/5'-nucleotidase n=1 Tax=Thermodesulfobium sp. 4217-1 TaxID=3120013 RepID=UPI003221CB84
MKTILTIVFILCLTLPFTQVVSANEDSESGDITILFIGSFINDLFPFENNSLKNNDAKSALLANMIEVARSENPNNTILISTGDIFNRSFLTRYFREKPVIEFMNYLKFDTMTLGFSEVMSNTYEISSYLKQLSFPVISINNERLKNMLGLSAYTFVERGGLKIAIIGISNPEKVAELIPGNLIQPYIDDARKDGADLVTLLSSIPVNLEEISGADIAIMNGYKDFPEGYKVVNKIISAKSGGFLGELKINVEKEDNGFKVDKVSDYSKSLSLEDNPQYDKYVLDMIKNYQSTLEKDMSKTIGETSTDIVNEGRKYGESNAGDMICDAMKEYSNSQIALFDTRSIGSFTIPKGQITLRQIYYDILPFSRVIIVKNLTGKQILDIIGHSKKLQVSGIKVIYNSKSPEDQRVEGVYIGDKPIEKDFVYRVAINDFIAYTNDLYSVTDEEDGIDGESAREVLARYIRKHSPISPRIEGRIILL